MGRFSTRLSYRFLQFFEAIRFDKRGIPVEIVQAVLNPSQMTMFQSMRAVEQVHAFSVLQRLRRQGQEDRDLLTAALLHDAGKNLYPLSLVERVIVVLGKKFLPHLARQWEQGKPRGLRRSFVVAARHAEWGAELLRTTGASPVAVELVRRHHDAVTADDGSLLLALQAADDST